MKQVFVTVLLEVENDTTIDECKEHVITAVSRWGGSGHPDDQFFPQNFQASILKSGLHGKPRRLKQQKPKDGPWD